MDGGKVRLRSRNNKDFNGRYPAIVKALAAMPDRTVIDGESVALDRNGKPSLGPAASLGPLRDWGLPPRKLCPSW
jgi:ATP-dependent DNA ligase